MFEAQLEVVDPQETIRIGRQRYGIEVEKVPGEPRSVVLKGDYEKLMSFMTEYMEMSSAEADIELKETSMDEMDDQYEDPMGYASCPECGAPPGDECDCIVVDAGTVTESINNDCPNCGAKLRMGTIGLCGECGWSDKDEVLPPQDFCSDCGVVFAGDQSADDPALCNTCYRDAMEEPIPGPFESTNFDKFVDNIVLTERKNRRTTIVETPIRQRYAQKMKGRHLQRTKFTGGK